VARYLLDTDVLIELAKGVAPVVAQVRTWISSGEDVGISAVQVAEYFAGIEPAGHRDAPPQRI
jgi:predicted nucleic acid-binding protein